ncbi:MAG: hypothetical protein E7264_10545 [Lachnospiraceae bacterium]|nr:hypothetical protein [Lachnospiraceae bacterium]
MVREENVKLMTKLAIYEKHNGKTEIPMSGYYKSDYVRMNCLKTVVAATVAFALVAAMIITYKMDYILMNVFKIDYKSFGMGVALIYAVWIFVMWLAARIVYSIRYEKARKHIIEYNHNLKKLQEESQKEMYKAMKGVVINDDFIDF